MAENFIISGSANKAEKYQVLVSQVEALIRDEPNAIANLANVAAAIQQTFSFLWTGFYLVEGDELVLGPFQGPVACTRIQYGKGVCGTAWQKGETIIVPDVEAFPGHIACSSLSKSEIVVPLKKEGKVVAVLDIDSREYNQFDNTDKEYLEQVAFLMGRCF